MSFLEEMGRKKSTILTGCFLYIIFVLSVAFYFSLFEGKLKTMGRNTERPFLQGFWFCRKPELGGPVLAS